MSEALLDVRNLSVSYGQTAILRDVSLQVQPGEIVGLVGESGSGKSTLIGAVLRTLGQPGRITSGSVDVLGQDVLAMGDEQVRSIRWRDVALVPQSALDALNPVLTVRRQLVDTMQSHRPTWSVAECDRRGRELMHHVGIGLEHYESYPHELSGGTRQRIAIAMALALDAPLIVLDEPTTALDVVLQGRILSRLRRLKEERGFAMLFITHDLPMLLKFADRLVVLYAGQVVEQGPTPELAQSPRHPYTQGLLGSLLSLDGPRSTLSSIPGTPPDPADLPSGCAFNPRCGLAEAQCQTTTPALHAYGARRVACHIDAARNG